MNSVLVTQPAVSFQHMHGALSRLGWSRAADTSVAPPLVLGEPEFASWSRHDDESISYTFNPVVKLRVLVFYGARADALSTEVESALPTLGVAELETLLQSTDLRELLLGVLAARELKAFSVIDLLEPLRTHRESVIARAAEKTHAELLASAVEVSDTAGQTAQKLLLTMLEVGAARLAKEQRRHPDRSAVFAHLGDAATRREIVLWLLHDRHRVNDDVIKVLRAALADVDWRVQVTAMLVAARFKAVALWPDVRQMELPEPGKKALDHRHSTLLAGIREAVLAELSSEPRPAHDDRHLLMPHLRSVVANEDDGIHDEARDWIENFLRAPAQTS
jgi:hypothetical protein